MPDSSQLDPSRYRLSAPNGNPKTPLKDGNNSQRSHGSHGSMEDMLELSSKKQKGGRLLKRYMLKPEVIYLKSKRDKMLVSTEKQKKFYPQDEYGYFGGQSPSRQDIYQNEVLASLYREERRRKQEQAHFKIVEKQNSTGSSNKVIDFRPTDPQLDRSSIDSRSKHLRHELNASIMGSMKSAVSHKREDSQTSISVQSVMSKAKQDIAHKHKKKKDFQMELPYWQRESYKSYKQIKHV